MACLHAYGVLAVFFDMDDFKYMEKSGMPGVLGWKEPWWKAGCGCMGYGKLLLRRCGADSEPAGVMVVVNDIIDLERERLGKWVLEPLSLEEKAKLLKDIALEFELGRLARENLDTLRKIGKLTNGAK